MAEEKSPKAGKVQMKDCRASFVNLFEPKPGRIDEETGVRGADKYQVVFLFPKDTPAGKALHKQIEAVIEQVKKDKWGASIPKLKAEKLCLRDGDQEDYDGYAGMWYVSTSNPDQPVIVDRDRSELTMENGGPSKIYSGAFINGTIRIWAQDNKHGKRVNASVEGVQYLRKGDAFGARPIDPNEEFDDLSDSDDDLTPLDDEDEASDLV